MAHQNKNNIYENHDRVISDVFIVCIFLRHYLLESIGNEYCITET